MPSELDSGLSYRIVNPASPLLESVQFHQSYTSLRSESSPERAAILPLQPQANLRSGSGVVEAAQRQCKAAHLPWQHPAKTIADKCSQHEGGKAGQLAE